MNMKKSWLIAILTALANFATTGSAATVSAGFNDLIMGFRATGGAGAAVNLEVNLGSVSQFVSPSGGSVTVSRLAVADLSRVYGATWNARLGVDLFWGAVGTPGRLAGGPNGQPRSTLWGTAVQKNTGSSIPWDRGSSATQNNGSVQIEGLIQGGLGSLRGATALASNDYSAEISASSVGSWTYQRGTTVAAFAFFLPNLLFDSPGTGYNSSKLDLYEIQPGDGPSTLLGTFSLSAAGVLTFTAAAQGATVAPAITAQPTAQTVTAGTSATFAVVVTGTPAPSYQWNKNGTPIAGATSATYTIPNPQPADAGNYAVTVTNSAGSVTSAAVALTVNGTVVNPGRLINLSILAPIVAKETMTLGTVVGGSGTSGTKALVIRAAGPALGQLGVTGVLPDPTMTLNNTSASPAVVVGVNNDWAGAADLITAFAQVGAFPYASPTSKDAGMYLPTLASGNYTVQVSDAGSGSGTVIAEIYDATPGSSFTATTPRLINVSVLKTIGAGTSLTAGFVIGGATSKTVLVRAVGPTLGAAPFNIGAVLADPKLELFNNSTGVKINENNDWATPVPPLTTTAAQLTAAFTSVGAFQLANTATKDAVLLVSLAPGPYSARVSGADNGGGTAIIEVYEVP
jgi:hypothetical protein